MTNLHRGRAPRAKTERVNLVLSEVENSNLAKAAEIMECSKSEVLREGLRRTVRNLKNKGVWDE